MIEIQRLQAGDVERLKKIRLASLKDAPDAFGTTYQEAMSRPENSWQDQLRILPTFIAVLNGVDSGIVRGSAHTEMTNVAYLISMWVAPDARGLEVGEALIDSVFHWARTAGYARLLLDVGGENANARALYERMGFKLTGVARPLPPPREYIQEYEMAIEL